MSSRIRLALLALALTVAAIVLAQRPHSPPVPAPPGAPSATAEAPATPRATTTTGFGRDVGFRSRELLTEHFRKHGAEFGATGAADYLARAQTLRDRAATGPVLELVRGDGVITRFDRESSAFIAFDSDGTIRTFFRPNNGEAYFRRQAQRAGGRR